jgi:hypothetical protein
MRIKVYNDDLKGLSEMDIPKSELTYRQNDKFVELGNKLALTLSTKQDLDNEMKYWDDVFACFIHDYTPESVLSC